MSVLDEQECQEIQIAFGLKPKKYQFQSIDGGLINSSFKLYSEDMNSALFFLQKMNTYAFKNPQNIMENIQRVTQVFKLQENSSFTSLHIKKTSNQNLLFRSSSNNYWRMFDFLNDFETLGNDMIPDNCYIAGRAFGHFIRVLSKEDIAKYHIIIPHFHDIKSRLFSLQKSIKSDNFGRMKDIRGLFEIINTLEVDCSIIQDVLDAQKIPTRICHNDTKSSNVMLHKQTQIAAVVDLDTVMPSSPLFDYGDSIRSIISTTKEDIIQENSKELNMHLFEAYSAGFKEELFDTLTELEQKLMIHACYTLPFIMGVRFLTDYLNGDVYFKINHPNQNLHRAHNQLNLANSIYSIRDELQRKLLSV